MKSEAKDCPFCEKGAVKGEREASYRRGKKVIKIKAIHWECVGECREADGVGVYRFEDAGCLRENDAEAREVWLRQYGEPMPVAGRPGRKVVERRKNRVAVLLTDSEIHVLDERRGRLSRSEYLRRSVSSEESNIPNFPLIEQTLGQKTRRAPYVRDIA